MVQPGERDLPILLSEVNEGAGEKGFTASYQRLSLI
jgi:hypothetical protein